MSDADEASELRKLLKESKERIAELECQLREQVETNEKLATQAAHLQAEVAACNQALEALQP